MDITDWPTPKTPNNILQMAENVECVGFDGLHTIDLQGFGKALTGANILREIRACGKSGGTRRTECREPSADRGSRVLDLFPLIMLQIKCQCVGCLLR